MTHSYFRTARIVVWPITFLSYVAAALHYENLPMQYTETFSAVKNENFIGKIWILLILLLETLIVGTLELPR